MGNRALEILPVSSREVFAGVGTIGLNPRIRNPRGGHSPGYRTPVAYCDTPYSYRRSWGHRSSLRRDRNNWLRYARGFEDGAAIGSPAVITTDTLAAGWVPRLAPTPVDTQREIVIWLAWPRASVSVGEATSSPRHRDRYPSTLKHPPPRRIHS